MTEDQLFNMSDEEAERAFMEARASMGSPETQIEEEYVEDEPVELEELATEQPEEVDSDEDDLETVEDVETSDGSNTTENELDEDIKDVEEQPEESNAEDTLEETITNTQKVKVRANGKDYEFTPKEMEEMFPKIFGQAIDYTKKTQAIKPWRKTIDAIEQAKLNHDDINLAIDVLRGDKNAIAEIIKRNGIDTLDLDTENSKYIPKDYGRDDTTLEIKDVVERISADREYETTHRILSKEWDENSFKELTKTPELIEALHVDVKTGMYAKVQPIAEKYKVFDGARKSDLEYYKLAAQEYFREEAENSRRTESLEAQRLAREAKLAKQQEIERVKAKQAKQVAIKEKVEVRKAAAPTKSNAGTKKVTDYLDDSDEAYDDWYQKNVLDKM